MAWIESHQELRNHPKTKRLARELRISPAAATGHLHFLWWWAIDYAPDGDLTEFDDWEIADAAGYECDEPAQFKDALIFSGFLDNTEQGTLIIHDWNDYAGKSLKQREQARKRTQRYREKQAANITERTRNAEETPTEPTQNGSKTDTQRNSDGDVTHTQRIQNAHETDTQRNGDASTGHDMTVQDITGHDSTVQDTTGQDTTVQVQDRTTPPFPPASGGMGEGAEPDAQEKRFDQFWAVYPKKQGKGDALKVWKRLKPDKALFEQILTSVKAHASRNPQWKRDGGQYIPNPATWLRQTRWLDEIPAQEGGAANAGRKTERIGGADGYADFQRSTGFRSADSDTDTDN